MQKNNILKIKNRFNSLNLIVKSSIVYTLASILTRGLGILTIPIFTRFLTPSEMGIVTIYNSWFGILSVLLSVGVTSGSFNIAMMEYKEERNQYMSSALFLTTIISTFSLLLFIIFSDKISSLLELPKILIFTMIIGFYVVPAYEMYLGKLRYEYNYKSIFWISVFTTIVATLFSVISVLFLKGKIDYNLGAIRLLSNNFIFYFISLIIYFSIFRTGKTIINSNYIKFALHTSLPLVLHSFSKQLLDVSDRMMLSKLAGLREVGIYGVLYSVSTLSLIIWSAINNSIIPFMFENIDQGEKKEKNLNLVIELLLIFYSIICILLTLIAPEIIKVLATSEYYSAIYLMPPIAAGIFFTSLYNIFSNVLLFYKKTHLIMISTIISALLNIILNYLFIPIYGAVAAAYTTLISYIVLSIFQYTFMNMVRKNRLLFKIKNIIKISVILVITILCINLLYSSNVIRYIIILVLIILLISKKNLVLSTLSVLKNKEIK